MNKYKKYEVEYAINHKKNINIRICIILYVYNEIRKKKLNKMSNM